MINRLVVVRTINRRAASKAVVAVSKVAASKEAVAAASKVAASKAVVVAKAVAAAAVNHNSIVLLIEGEPFTRLAFFISHAQRS